MFGLIDSHFSHINRTLMVFDHAVDEHSIERHFIVHIHRAMIHARHACCGLVVGSGLNGSACTKSQGR
jgi:hypothetical protein